MCSCRRLPSRRVGRVMIALKAAHSPIAVAPSGSGLSEASRDVPDGAPRGGAAGRELPDGLVAAAVRGDGRL